MHGALPRPVFVVVIALPLLLAVAAVVIALIGPKAGSDTNRTGSIEPTTTAGPLVLPAVPAPAAGSPECAALQAALPDRLQSGPVQLARRTLADPAPPGAAAWGAGSAAGLANDRPVILRCGLDRPDELTPTAVLLEVSGVRWLRLASTDTSTWVAADRPVYVALTLSDDAGTGPLQDVSAAIRATLAQRSVQPIR